MKSLLSDAIRAGSSPGAAVAIVKDSSIIYLKGFGLKQVGKPDSIECEYRIPFRLRIKMFCFRLAGTLVNDQRL